MKLYLNQIDVNKLYDNLIFNENLANYNSYQNEDPSKLESIFNSSISSDGTDYIGYVINGSSTDGYSNPKNPHYWAIILLLIPLITIFGNILVVLSVLKEKSLRTVTNYFVVSLALADLTVASAVMPLAVYLEVSNDVWGLSQVLCDAFLATDVMASTASILNLVAIAIDRFIAVTQPIKYAQHKNSKRIFFMLAFVWIVSIAIASPMVFGLNSPVKGQERNIHECSFENPIFIIFSSLFSFYIPAIAMIFLYYQIFKVIRTRAKKTRGGFKAFQLSKKRNPKKESLQTTNTYNNSNNNNKTVILGEKHETLVSNDVNNTNFIESSAFINPKDIVQTLNGAILNNNPNKKILQKDILKKKASTGASSLNTNASNKEKKVTKTLAIVIGLFLICWIPFFTVNMLNAICIEFKITCDILHGKLFKLFVWLGYINSFLNPIIYTIFNVEFRKAFVKLLSDPFNLKSR